jgi:hypothetical protein
VPHIFHDQPANIITHTVVVPLFTRLCTKLSREIGSVMFFVIVVGGIVFSSLMVLVLTFARSFSVPQAILATQLNLWTTLFVQQRRY